MLGPVTRLAKGLHSDGRKCARLPASCSVATDRCISVITPSPGPTARRDNVTPPPTDNNQTDTSTGGAVVPDTDPSDTATGGATEPDNSQTRHFW